MALVVEELRDRRAFAALAPAWEVLRERIAEQGGAAGPFLSPGWFAIYAASFPSASLRLFVAHEAGQLRGVLPLVGESRFVGGIPARMLRSLSDDHSQRFDVLMETADVAHAFRAHLDRSPDWDVIELRDVPVRIPSGAKALLGVAAGHPTGCWVSQSSPYLPLPSTPEGLEQLLGAKFRANLRRRRRNLAEKFGAVVLERIENDAGRRVIDQALDEGFRLEASGWKGARKTAIACDAVVSKRYRLLAHAFAKEGKLALSFLRVGETRRAFHLGIIDRGVYFLFKPGHDAELASYGLGHLLVDAVARDLIGRGVREFDFLGDDMPWKRQWTQLNRPHAWHYLFRPSLFGRFLHAWKFGVGPALKRLGSRGG